MIKPHLRLGAAFANRRIGLLGGSFNPAHPGHRAISLHALKQLRLDQIWWLVSPQNPLKSSQDMAPLDQRMRRARQIAAHPRICVTDIEAALGTHYTADTLRALRRRFPQTRFVWLMGADNLRQMPRWRDWQDIFHLTAIAVFRRPSYRAGYGMGKAAIRFERHRKKTLKNKKSLPAWAMLDNKLNDLSATLLRKDSPSWQS